MSDTNERSVASTGSRCVDICDRLRIAPAKLIGTVDEDTYWACHEAADKIDRMRLTDEEREAIRRAVLMLDGVEDLLADAGALDAEAVTTLRGLLERLA